MVKAAYDNKMCADFFYFFAHFILKPAKEKSMLQRLAYRYHRFLGIMFLTIICTRLTGIDFTKIRFSKSKTSSILVRKDELSSLKSANAWINSPSFTASEHKGKIVKNKTHCEQLVR